MPISIPTGIWASKNDIEWSIFRALEVMSTWQRHAFSPSAIKIDILLPFSGLSKIEVCSTFPPPQDNLIVFVTR